MDLLEIKTAGNPVLKTICAPVEKIDKRLRTLLDKMAETMYAHEGVGIAAPQVGISIRAAVVDNEGCLSCPDLFGDVERAEKIRVEYISRFGKKKTLDADGLLARCIQHELDHLDGQLFIDIAKNITKGRKNSDA